MQPDFTSSERDLTTTFQLRLRVADVSAAFQLFSGTLRWLEAPSFHDGSRVLRPPSPVVPMLEIESRLGPGEMGFYGVHVEVDDLDDLAPELGWMEPVGPGREERPPGRDLLSLRWRNWPFHIGLFAARPPYRLDPAGSRCVAIGRVPSVERGAERLREAGWTIAHRWSIVNADGAYLKARPDTDVELSIVAAGDLRESIEVDWCGSTAETAMISDAIPGLTTSR